MKKILAFILAAIFLFGLASCRSTTSSNSNSQGDNSTSNQVEANRILITYFSATNITESIANKIHNNVSSNIFEIEPEIPYTQEDLAYYTGGRADQEQNDSNARPAIKTQITNIDDYNTIFLGYPIWHGQAPRIISTFLENYNFKDKIIIPFCTSHSSGIGSSATNLYPLANGANWKVGQRFSSSTTNEEIATWIETLNLNTSNVSSFNLQDAKNGASPMVTLNNGLKMPILGLGTYSLQGDTCVEAVKSALALGYRLIDTAYMYGNEKEIGKAIKESGIPREEIFVITKIYPGTQFENPTKAIEDALENLDIGYIDMILLHHPGVNDVKAYKEIERYIGLGKIRSVGLSNWYIEQIDDFISKVNIKPALIQNEIHPYYQEIEVIPYMHNLDIAMQAWYPLGGRGHTQELLNDEVLKTIANNHNVSVAQIILRWDLQNGVIVIPGSSNPSHQEENISVFEFELTKEEMNQIKELNRNEKHDWY